MYPGTYLNIFNKFEEKSLILPNSRLIRQLGIIRFLLRFKGQFYTERLQQYAANQSLLIASQEQL